MKNHYDFDHITRQIRKMAGFVETCSEWNEEARKRYIKLFDRFLALKKKDADAMKLDGECYKLDKMGLRDTETYMDLYDEYCKACDKLIMKLEIELDMEKK